MAIELSIPATTGSPTHHEVRGTEHGVDRPFPTLPGATRRVTGLTNGSRYRFSVRPCNAAGCASGWSPLSAEVRPIGPLGSPTLHVPSGQTTFDVTWSLPDLARAGRALTRVRVCIDWVGCSDRSTASGGSQRVTVPNETTTDAVIEVTDEAGRTTRATASGRSPDHGSAPNEMTTLSTFSITTE